jgi:hypothetical protein
MHEHETIGVRKNDSTAVRKAQDSARRLASTSKHALATAIGAALIIGGSAIVSTLVSTSWNSPVGLFAILMILEGIDCLFFALTKHDRSAPILFPLVAMVAVGVHTSERPECKEDL